MSDLSGMIELPEVSETFFKQNRCFKCSCCDGTIVMSFQQYQKVLRYCHHCDLYFTVVKDSMLDTPRSITIEPRQLSEAESSSAELRTADRRTKPVPEWSPVLRPRGSPAYTRR